MTANRIQIVQGDITQQCVDAIVNAAKAAEDEEEVPEWQTVLDSADMLRTMTESLLARLPSTPLSPVLRADVAEMISRYISGQQEVLQDLVRYSNVRETGGVAMARRDGIIIQLDGDASVLNWDEIG